LVGSCGRRSADLVVLGALPYPAADAAAVAT
jgi:hypothetical protein